LALLSLLALAFLELAVALLLGLALADAADAGNFAGFEIGSLAGLAGLIGTVAAVGHVAAAAVTAAFAALGDDVGVGVVDDVDLAAGEGRRLFNQIGAQIEHLALMFERFLFRGD